jgi:hypothetical protein
MIWNDDKFPFISDDCQLVFFHIMTTPLSNPIGLFKVSIAGMADEKRWPAKRYDKPFREGMANGFWKYDERNMLLYIPNFVEYNPPDNPNVVKSWAKIYNELPSSVLKDEYYDRLKGYLEGFAERLREGFMKPFREGFAKGARKGLPIQEQEQEQEQDIGIGIGHNPPPPEFSPAPFSPDPKPDPPSSRFTKPTLDEVTAYCRERKNGVDPQKWIDHYTSNGWKVGKNKMVDWKAAVRTWENNDVNGGNGNGGKPFKASQSSPYLVCPHCHEEYPDGDVIQYQGKTICPKCPEARIVARESMEKLAGLGGFVKGVQ